MTIFMWAFVVIEGLTCLLHIILIAQGRAIQKSPGAMAVDVVFNLGFVAWALWLLATQGAGNG